MGIKTIGEKFTEVLLYIFLIGGIILAIEEDSKFIVISLISIILIYLINRRFKNRVMKEFKEHFKKSWGKGQVGQGPIKESSYLYLYLKEDNKDFFIDDISWRDLDMDLIFRQINHTKSLPGDQYLYYLLRKPLFNHEDLEKRSDNIDKLRENLDYSLEAQYILNYLSKDNGKKIINYFKNGLDQDSKYLPVYVFLSYLPFIGALGFLYNVQLGFVSMVTVIMLNTLVYRKIKDKIYEEMDIFRSINGLGLVAKKLDELNKKNPGIYWGDFGPNIKQLNKISKNISKININEKFSNEMELLVHYYNMIFLKEPKYFYKAVKDLNQFKEIILDIYRQIGELDAYISVASYIEGLAYYSRPNLNYGSRSYLVEDLYHPLLKDPVSYSFCLDNKSMLITGSNASGKSTFLRSVGINSLISQTLNISYSRSYRAGYYRLLSSIGNTDSIEDGDSYFMTEAKSLKRIIDASLKYDNVLCILDEIFRGTNTNERISSAKFALEYMSSRGVCSFAATHDLELTGLLSEDFEKYYFTEYIADKDISFDYILRKGVSRGGNAISILEYLGYPEEIYKPAREFIKKEIEGC